MDGRWRRSIRSCHWPGLLRLLLTRLSLNFSLGIKLNASDLLRDAEIMSARFRTEIKYDVRYYRLDENRKKETRPVGFEWCEVTFLMAESRRQASTISRCGPLVRPPSLPFTMRFSLPLLYFLIRSIKNGETVTVQL